MLVSPMRQVFVSLRSTSKAAIDQTAPWAAPAFVLHGFWDELDRRGISVDELERSSGVKRPRKDDFLSTLSSHEIEQLFNCAVSLTGDATLGLSVRQAMSCPSLHLIGHIILASATFSQAIALISTHGPRWCRGPAIEDLPDGRKRVGFYRDMGPSPGACVKSQLVAVSLHEIAQHFANASADRLIVQLDFPKPADTSAYERAFPGGVEFDASGAFITFPRALLHQRRSGANPALAEQLVRLAQQYYATSDEDDEWTSSVRRALRTNAAPRLLEPHTLAAQLGVSARMLARRLAREGTSFCALMDQVLYERAQALLTRPRATCVQVAEALGYSETSSFNRAFRRWSGGLTPTQYRERQRAT